MHVKQCQHCNTKLLLRFLQKILVTGLIFIIYFSSHEVPKHESLIFRDILPKPDHNLFLLKCIALFSVGGLQNPKEICYSSKLQILPETLNCDYYFIVQGTLSWFVLSCDQPVQVQLVWFDTVDSFLKEHFWTYFHLKCTNSWVWSLHKLQSCKCFFKCFNLV